MESNSIFKLSVKVEELYYGGSNLIIVMLYINTMHVWLTCINQICCMIIKVLFA
jgi:hypothetical protein